MKTRLLCLIILFAAVIGVYAQEPARYFWEAAGLYIPVPEGWAAPVPLEQNGAPVLLLKPTLLGADAAEGITIQFKLVPIPPDSDSALLNILNTEFMPLGLRVSDLSSAPWLGSVALETFSTDEAETLYGRARVFPRPDQQGVIMMAYGPLAQLDEINATFLKVAYGVTDTEVDPGPRPYGPIWQRLSTGMDGEQAFIEPQALTTDGTLVYVADRLNGLLMFSARTGAFLNRVPDVQTNDLAPSGMGVYAADSEVCGCIKSITLNQADIIADDFGDQAPAFIALDGEGRLYATDVKSDGTAFVRVFEYNIEQEPLTIDPPVTTQPALFGYPDQTLNVALFGGGVMRLNGSSLSLVDGPDLIGNALGNTIGQLENGDYLVMNQERLLSRLDATGKTTPLGISLSPDNTLIRVAIDPQGTLYTLEQTPEGSLLTAWRSDAVLTGIGTQRLEPGRITTYFYNGIGGGNTWLIIGHAGERVVLSGALLGSESESVLKIDLFNGAGQNLGSYTLSTLAGVPSESQSPIQVTFDHEGFYRVEVNPLVGFVEGYQIGYRVAETLPTLYHPISGTLSEAMPIQQWIIPATAGQTLTVHVTATSGTLDPSLRLVNPRGVEVEVNEDLDPTLGLDAELTEIRLSNNGDYLLEVRATSGEGSYTLTTDLSE